MGILTVLRVDGVRRCVWVAMVIRPVGSALSAVASLPWTPSTRRTAMRAPTRKSRGSLDHRAGRDSGDGAGCMDCMKVAGWSECVVKVTTLTEFADLSNWRDLIAFSGQGGDAVIILNIISDQDY